MMRTLLEDICQEISDTDTLCSRVYESAVASYLGVSLEEAQSMLWDWSKRSKPSASPSPPNWTQVAPPGSGIPMPPPITSTPRVGLPVRPPVPSMSTHSTLRGGSTRTSYTRKIPGADDASSKSAMSKAFDYVTDNLGLVGAAAAATAIGLAAVYAARKYLKKRRSKKAEAERIAQEVALQLKRAVHPDDMKTPQKAKTTARKVGSIIDRTLAKHSS